MKKTIDFHQFSQNQQKLIAGILSNNSTIDTVSDTNILIFKKNKKRTVMIGSYTECIPYNIGLIISNKYLTRSLLQSQNIPIPVGDHFEPENHFEAFAYAKKIGYPVILKTENNESYQQSLLVSKEIDFKPSFSRMITGHDSIIVEKYFPGSVYRILYTINGYISFLQKKRSLLVMSNQNMKPDNYSNVTDQMSKKVIPIAQKILDCFPKAVFTAFEMLIPYGIKNKYLITAVYPSPGISIHFRMSNNIKKNKHASEVIADLLI